MQTVKIESQKGLEVILKDAQPTVRFYVVTKIYFPESEKHYDRVPLGYEIVLQDKEVTSGEFVYGTERYALRQREAEVIFKHFTEGSANDTKKQDKDI